MLPPQCRVSRRLLPRGAVCCRLALPRAAARSWAAMPTPDQPRPPEGYVSSAEACRRLGIADRTLRRRVADGKIEGEYLPRPQGSVLYVKLPPEQTAEDAAPPSTPPADQDSPPHGEDAAEAASLVKELLERNTVQAERIAALERENGRLESDAIHAREAARIERERRQEAEAEVERLNARRWWRWW